MIWLPESTDHFILLLPNTQVVWLLKYMYMYMYKALRLFPEILIVGVSSASQQTPTHYGVCL